MTKRVLWIDDSRDELDAARRMLSPIAGIDLVTASSSDEAATVLAAGGADAIVTDILRRNPDRTVSDDDGYEFFERAVRPGWPELPVIFHTKNLPGTFRVDPFAQYLSKWDPEELKGVELETRLASAVRLYEAFADRAIWRSVEPRLVRVNRSLLARLDTYADIRGLTPSQFEELVAEVLEKEGFDVLWIPGGSDGGIDIVAGSRSGDILIDVKHYRETHSVGVELVRCVYGVAESVSRERGRPVYGGIITSSRFTSGARAFRDAQRVRPLLRDGDWLRSTLAKYLPRRGSRGPAAGRMNRFRTPVVQARPASSSCSATESCVGGTLDVGEPCRRRQGMQPQVIAVRSTGNGSGSPSRHRPPP